MPGRPAARLTDAVEGGVIVQGSSSVLIGDGANGRACSVCHNAVTTGKPVNPLLGCKILAGAEELDFALPGPMPLVWQRTYSSYNGRIGLLGQGWSLPASPVLEPAADACRLVDTQGRTLTFEPLRAEVPQYSASEDLWLLAGGGEGEWGIRWQQIPLAWRRNPQLAVIGTSSLTAYVFAPDPTGTHWRLRATLDALGQCLRYDWQDGVLTQVEDGSGRRYRLQYQRQSSDHPADPGLRLVAIWLDHDPRASDGEPVALVRYGFDAAGDLVSVTDQYGQTARSFRYQHHLLTSHSRYGEIQAEYDYLGDQAGSRVSQQRQPDGTRYDYAYYPDRTEVTDQLGRKQVYTFAGEAGLQRLTALQRPDGSRWTYRHDQAGRRIGEIDPLGRARWTRQGGEGKVSGATTPDGQSLSLEWDKERPLLRAVRGPDQAEWRYDYDERGRLIAETDPLGAITRLDYEGSGPPDRPSRVADAHGGIRRFEWSADGLLQAHTDCSGRITRYTYNRWGQLLSVTDALGRTQQRQYEQGRLSLLIQPDGRRLQFSYDVAGRLTQVREQGQVRLSMAYDPYGRLIARQLLGATLRFTYDEAGRLAQLINENGACARFQYDLLDQLIEETGFDGRVQRYRYNAAGELIALDDNGQCSQFRYDPAGRLIERQLPATEVCPAQTHRFRYDAAGRLIEATTGRVSSGFRYDKAGQLLEETSRHALGFEHRLQHRNDRLGHRIATTLSDQREVGFLYYGHGHLHQLLLDQVPLLDFERDALHRETGRQGFGGWQQRQYDLQGRLVRQYSNQPVLAWQWEYDPDGLLIGSEQAGQAWRYHYDAQQRLVGWRKPDQAADWTFDPAGNRLPAPLPPLPPKPHRDWASQVRANLDNHDFDLLAPDFDPHPSARPPIDCWPGNRVDFDGAIDYRYDAHGNLVERYDHAGPCRLHLGYDGLHQLHCSKRTEHDGQSRTTWYDYDAFGRRIAKQTGDQITWYGWDGDRLCLIDNPDRQSRIVYRPGSFTPLLRLDTAKPPKQAAWKPPQAPKTGCYLFHTDHLGTPYALTDPDGQRVWQAQIDPWGQLLNESGPLQGDQPLRLPGQWQDEETGFHYNRFRYYDPQLGRYVTQDPVGWHGGTNAYTYADNSPVSRIDPLGLTTCLFELSKAKLTCMGESGQVVKIEGTKKYGFEKNANRVFSGQKTDNCMNNPACANRSDLGPVPPGDYTLSRRSIDPNAEHNKYYWWNLNPKPGTDVYGRSLFRMHPGEVSQGCITILLDEPTKKGGESTIPKNYLEVHKMLEQDATAGIENSIMVRP